MLLLTNPAWAESTRIEVYPLSQNYWDVKPGDTLGEIVDTLIPDNVYLQEKLIRDILSLNPDVFPDGNPHRMLANKRLWLPNALTPPNQATGTSDYIVETYQWGSIRKRNGY
jgi:Tfp pilus assembly protein FimV